MTKCIIFWLLIFILSFQTVQAQNFPNPNWEYYKNTSEAGWDQKKVDTLYRFIVDSTFITGFLIIHDGKVVYEFGDIKENSYIASCRKSVLSMIYGEHIKSGEIKLDKTLTDLGIDDVGGLLPIEKTATIRDIISARSGVYHPASYPGDYLDVAPKRGSVKPGYYWLYSNWDFNVAGYIFEKETHRNIYDEIERILARPLQMQDWDHSLQKKEGDSTKSYYPAYPIFFSTRDMARLGLLMLNKGKWGDKRVIDKSWVEDMVSPKTDYTEVNKNAPAYRGTGYYFGYGYMWWLWQNVTDERFREGFSAFGSYGQSITVFPAINTVIVYKTKDDYDRMTPYLAWFKVLRLAVEAYLPKP